MPLFPGAPGEQQSQQLSVPHGVAVPRQVATAPAHVDCAPVLLHATPALQHALPQRVVPAGHPQVPLEASRHATPDLQQQAPQGVVPAAHGAAPAVDGPEQVTASARNGRRTVAATAATVNPPMSFSAPRRDVAAPIVRANSSKSLTTRHPPIIPR